LFKKNKVAGIDEVGRGCLAGPVFSAAVILNEKINKKDIKDSKKIPFKKRILLSKYIKKNFQKIKKYMQHLKYYILLVGQNIRVNKNLNFLAQLKKN